MAYISSSRKVNSRRNRRIVAGEDVSDVSVAPEATELLFEAENVAELVAEVTEQDVVVDADEDTVTFTVGNMDYTVQADGQEEVMEATRRPLRGKRPVRASHRVSARNVSSRTSGGRVVRRISR